MYTVLGIESSCDETAASVVRGTTPGPGTILSNVVASQFESHKPFGGVVPEIAARAHVEVIEGVVRDALEQAQVSLGEVDAIAATAGPGLVGGVAVGLTLAKGLAFGSGKPLIAVNHLEGHARTVRLTHGVVGPYLLLLVSGGHCQLVLFDGEAGFERLGTTLDDAVGEAFDKCAKALGLGLPGGPEVERVAKLGDATRFKFPKPMAQSDGMDFSFSGLKTAVRRVVEMTELDEQTVCDIAASFQFSAITALISRVLRAVDVLEARGRSVKTLVAAGGVAANRALVAGLSEVADRTGMVLYVPPPKLCTDNAAMIAWTGIEIFGRGVRHPLSQAARARWPLSEPA